ncbi:MULTISPECIES: hypothetical protein [Klebsiella pneumoniae complex]|uniref:hypothetical protein n=1 Tax=Klebsiella pneumoniae complex TaxID=3390273 RepID=UPI0003BDFC58|nr:hypothetical protein [Klebsiella pneumoniae]EIX9589494.1 hypothetical protein [Klebsiella pneumoniae]EKU4920316.1 hypothetical protein [Klebsiella pneumoniae]ESM63875.1 phage protein [Klebsiella pneumoniae MGH 46]MBD7867027.1 hypothetical protein [Klebsiella pneumoniae]RDG83931.1 hypothetical protein DWA36_20500 [Klebsiella pneumoniae]
MNVKLFGIIILCILMFTLGFFIGGFKWEWAESKHASEVALWAMLGGWLSAFATLVAVMVSLYMAYQAVQSEIEKIRVIHGISGVVSHGKGVNCSLTIQNMRNLRVNITGIYFSLGKSSGRYSLEKTVQLNNVSLSHKGERAAFCFVIDSGVTWWGIYSLFDKDEKINFKKGKIFITTDLNTYEFKLPKHYLTAFEDAYSYFQTIK